MNEPNQMHTSRKSKKTQQLPEKPWKTKAKQNHRSPSGEPWETKGGQNSINSAEELRNTKERKRRHSELVATVASTVATDQNRRRRESKQVHCSKETKQVTPASISNSSITLVLLSASILFLCHRRQRETKENHFSRTCTTGMGHKSSEPSILSASIQKKHEAQRKTKSPKSSEPSTKKSHGKQSGL